MIFDRNRFADYGSHLALVNLSFDHVRCSLCGMRALRIHEQRGKGRMRNPPPSPDSSFEPRTPTSTSRQHK
jgi:hypothetical protein